jgi:hypothetical protein
MAIPKTRHARRQAPPSLRSCGFVHSSYACHNSIYARSRQLRAFLTHGRGRIEWRDAREPNYYYVRDDQQCSSIDSWPPPWSSPSSLFPSPPSSLLLALRSRRRPLSPTRAPSSCSRSSASGAAGTPLSRPPASHGGSPRGPSCMPWTRRSWASSSSPTPSSTRSTTSPTTPRPPAAPSAR